MSFESDGIGELAEDTLRAGMLFGTRVAARMQQSRANALEQAAQQTQQQAEDEREQQRVAREAAMRSLTCVNSEQWWDRAGGDDIRGAWTTAQEYRGEDPRADAAAARMGEQLHDRYGVNVDQTDPSQLSDDDLRGSEVRLSPDELAELDRRSETRLDELQQERETASPERAAEIDHETAQLIETREVIGEDLGERGATVSADANSERRTERNELMDAELRTGTTTYPAGAAAAAAAADPGYDSSERRDAMRERLSEDPQIPDQAVDARVLTDMGQAQPVSEAVVQRPGQRSEARTATPNPRGQAPSRQRSR